MEGLTYPPGEVTSGNESSYGSSSPPDADKLLQEEIMKLSLEERNENQEEIHGVRIIAKEETPELLKESLSQLDTELNSKRFANFLKSQQTLPTYVNTEAFRLRFLRCTLFDVPSAARQIDEYLGVASELFGEIALQRPVRMSDFSKTELRQFRKGRFQFLPYRDRAGKRGRRILVAMPDAEWGRMPANVIAKIRLYMLYVAGEDIEAQKYGIVAIVWFDKEWKEQATFLSGKITPMGTRISSIHVCTPDTPYYRIRRANIITRFQQRSRAKIHIGQSMELMYTLQSFGIPVDYIPISFTGRVKDKYIKEWIRLRQLIEDERLTPHWGPESKSTMIESPYADDVIFRNGTSLLSHPGNSSLRTMIALKIMDDDTKNIKTLTAEIIEETKEENNNRRFLIWDEKGWWKEIPKDKEQEEVQKRISRIVRNTRKALLTNPQTADYEEQVNPYMFVDRNATGSEKRQRLSCGPDDCTSKKLCQNPKDFFV